MGFSFWPSVWTKYPMLFLTSLKCPINLHWWKEAFHKPFQVLLFHDISCVSAKSQTVLRSQEWALLPMMLTGWWREKVSPQKLNESFPSALVRNAGCFYSHRKDMSYIKYRVDSWKSMFQITPEAYFRSCPGRDLKVETWRFGVRENGGQGDQQTHRDC